MREGGTCGIVARVERDKASGVDKGGKGKVGGQG